MNKIGFIGAGKMAEAMIRGIKGKYKINVSDHSPERLTYMKEKYSVNIYDNNIDLLDNSDIIILSIKPQNMGEVLDEIKDHIKDQLIISIAAGVKIEKISSRLPGKKIVRVMPNTPCLVGEMAAGYSTGDNLTDEDKKTVKDILLTSGIAYELKEDLLDSVTGISGSGPAFFSYILQCFIDSGIKQGFSSEISRELALQTMKGTAILLQKQKMSTKELIDMVSSPNGTTVAGREVLENSEIKNIILKAVEEAVKRSKELGK